MISQALKKFVQAKMSAEHKSVARALAYVLHLGDTDAWFNFQRF